MLSFLSTAWSAVSGLFGGSSSKAILWLSIALGVALLLCWGLWQRGEAKDAQGQAARLMDANKLQEAALRDMQRFQAALSSALSERETTLKEIEARRQAQRLEWERLVHDDQDVAAWAATPVPDAVRNLLQR